jgi:hypothetical protein
VQGIDHPGGDDEKMARDRSDRRIFVGGPMGRKIGRKDQNFRRRRE